MTDGEDLCQRRADAAQRQPSTLLAELVVQLGELANERRRHPLDAGKVQDHIAATEGLGQSEELAARFLNGFIAENARSRESSYRNTMYRLDFQPVARRSRHHG